MRRSTVVNLNRVKFAQFLAKNHMILLLTVIFIAGVVAGTVSISNSNKVVDISKYLLNTYITQRTGGSFPGVMFVSLFTSVLTMLIIFVSGASMLGVVIVPLFVAIRGFCYGAVSAYLYSVYSVRGIAFNAVLIIPAALVFLISFLLAARESVQFSLVIARMTFPRSGSCNLSADFRNYCARYVFLCVVIIISAIIDAVLSCSFMSFFEL